MNLKGYAYNYLDDIVLATETFEDHIRLLRVLLLRIKRAGLTIKWSKSHFCCKEVQFLGFVVNEKGIMIDPEKTGGIQSYPRSRTLRQMCRFLGKTPWLRKFIEKYAILVDALTNLSK